MRSLLLIVLSHLLFIGQVFGMAQENQLMNTAGAIGRFAGRVTSACPEVGTAAAGLVGTTVGSVFGRPAEGFVAGALVWNGALTRLTRSEVAVASATQAVFEAAAELGHVVDHAVAEEIARERLHRMRVRLYVGAGVVAAGYVIKKSKIL